MFDQVPAQVSAQVSEAVSTLGGWEVVAGCLAAFGGLFAATAVAFKTLSAAYKTLSWSARKLASLGTPKDSPEFAALLQLTAGDPSRVVEPNNGEAVALLGWPTGLSLRCETFRPYVNGVTDDARSVCKILGVYTGSGVHLDPMDLTETEEVRLRQVATAALRKYDMMVALGKAKARVNRRKDFVALAERQAEGQTPFGVPLPPSVPAPAKVDPPKAADLAQAEAHAANHCTWANVPGTAGQGTWWGWVPGQGYPSPMTFNFPPKEDKENGTKSA